MNNSFTCISKALNSDQIAEMCQKQVWRPECPVPLERLRKVCFSHYTFDNTVCHEGELVVLDSVAPFVENIFKKLFEVRFPIQQARAIEYYDGSDERSLADNNSACFNCREILGGGIISIHSYGLAIDINPIQNPYIAPQDLSNPLIGQLQILPAAGAHYLNRRNRRPGMVEDIVDIFKENGFYIWGGNWNDPIDYQHFQPSRAMAQMLATMTSEHASHFFKLYVQQPLLMNQVDAKQNCFIELYHRNPQFFMDALQHKSDIMSWEPLQAQQYFETILG